MVACLRCVKDSEPAADSETERSRGPPVPGENGSLLHCKTIAEFYTVKKVCSSLVDS